MRVFTPNDVHEKRYPKPAHFLEVARDLKISFKELYEKRDLDSVHPKLLGAVLIGSLARQHDMTCTSDVDVVVFYDDSQVLQTSVFEGAFLWRSTYIPSLVKAARWNIPVNVYNVFMTHLLWGTTRHNRQFLKHAIYSMDGFNGTSPSGLMSGDKEAIRAMFEQARHLTLDEALKYITSKQEKLRDGYFSWGGLSPEQAAKLYAQAFNAPFHAGRQVLDICCIPYPDTKEGVIEKITSLDEGVSKRLTEIHFLAKTYVRECEIHQNNRTGTAKKPELNFEKTFMPAYEALSGLYRVLDGSH